MRKKVIAIDINEVIRDFRNSFAKQYEKEFKRKLDEELPIDMSQFDMDKAFPFYDEDGRVDSNRRHKFQYEDHAFEIYARADATDLFIAPHLTNWVYNELFDYEPEENPEILIVSPLEGNLSIPSTFSFLARIGLKCRNVYFPVDSATIWDRCDILITANPKLIKSKPEGKEVIKINAAYNTDAETRFSFDSLKELIDDPRHIVNCMLEDKNIQNIEDKNKKDEQ